MNDLSYIEQLHRAFDTIHLEGKNGTISYEEFVKQVAALFQQVRLTGNNVFFIGNGGSAGIAVHMTADFLKNGRVNTQSLFDISTITCLANDYGYEYVFSKQIEKKAKENDILVVISSSGNSPNIVRAIEAMKANHGLVITLSGFKDDNAIAHKGVFNLHVPCFVYGIVESIHNLVLQHIVDILLDS